MPMEDLLTRQAPHSQEAEQSVLGSMLIDSRCISDVVGVVRPEDFYLQANREIYETMYEMFSYSEVIDPVTVLDKMRARGVYNEERGQTAARPRTAAPAPAAESRSRARPARAPSKANSPPAAAHRPRRCPAGRCSRFRTSHQIHIPVRAAPRNCSFGLHRIFFADPSVRKV